MSQCIFVLCLWGSLHPKGLEALLFVCVCHLTLDGHHPVGLW